MQSVDTIDFLSRHMRLLAEEMPVVKPERINAELGHAYSRFRTLVGDHGDLDQLWQEAARISILLATYVDAIEERRDDEE